MQLAMQCLHEHPMTTCLQVLVCIFLWFIVDVLKTLFAKFMAGHFHQETYFQRMQEALRKEYFLMALSQPRPSDNRASKHMRVASVTAGMMTGKAASVTTGMEPRNMAALQKAHQEQAGQDRAQDKRKAAPKGIMRNLKSGASGIASVAPRMVKFRSNIQYLGEKASVLELACLSGTERQVCCCPCSLLWVPVHVLGL